jgi:hypothetical protein
MAFRSRLCRRVGLATYRAGRHDYPERETKRHAYKLAVGDDLRGVPYLHGGSLHPYRRCGSEILCRFLLLVGRHCHLYEGIHSGTVNAAAIPKITGIMTGNERDLIPRGQLARVPCLGRRVADAGPVNFYPSQKNQESAS